MSKTDEVVKREALKRIKRIVIRVDCENQQKSSIGKSTFLDVRLDEETGDLVSTCNVDQIEVSADAMQDKLLASFGNLIQMRCLRDARSAAHSGGQTVVHLH